MNAINHQHHRRMNAGDEAIYIRLSDSVQKILLSNDCGDVFVSTATDDDGRQHTLTSVLIHSESRELMCGKLRLVFILVRFIHSLAMHYYSRERKAEYSPIRFYYTVYSFVSNPLIDREREREKQAQSSGWVGWYHTLP
jgi:hypothetical protein